MIPSFIIFSWALSLGFVPQQMDIVENKTAQIDSSKIATVASFEVGVTAWDRIHVYGEAETFQYYSNGSLSFNPYRANYIFGADFYITEMVSFGVVHECDHPIVSTINLTNNEYNTDYRYAKNETKIFIKIGSNVRAK